jgi:predicted DNA-binding protein
VRSGKGRLRVAEGMRTTDIKVRLDEVLAGDLRSMAKRLGVPMAKIVREGVEIRLRELQAQDNENYYKEEIDYEKR